jgi:AcrR family transcriptional regulator
MAQYLKEHVRERILSAALDVFAARGFRAATMAEIAREAGVATGNLYRYFPDKDTLFHAVVPRSFADALLGLLRRRVRALAGVADARGLPPASPFRVVSENLLAFCLANRQRVVALLARADGTRYQDFPERLVAEMGRLAVQHHRRLGLRFEVGPVLRFALRQIYRNWLRALVEILSDSPDERTARDRVEAFSAYHLAGLKGLFE